MNAGFSFHDLTIQLRVEVIDPAAVLSHPAAMHLSIGPDGHLAVYTPGTIEEAVVSRFTAMMDALYEPSGGLHIVQHCERLRSWDEQRDPRTDG